MLVGMPYGRRVTTMLIQSLLYPSTVVVGDLPALRVENSCGPRGPMVSHGYIARSAEIAARCERRQQRSVPGGHGGARDHRLQYVGLQFVFLFHRGTT